RHEVRVDATEVGRERADFLVVLELARGRLFYGMLAALLDRVIFGQRLTGCGFELEVLRPRYEKGDTTVLVNLNPWLNVFLRFEMNGLEDADRVEERCERQPVGEGDVNQERRNQGKKTGAVHRSRDAVNEALNSLDDRLAKVLQAGWHVVFLPGSENPEEYE